ncbi:MAG: hypothetical protein ACI4IX_08495 [Acutalibacteraceae bacterium]
MKKILALLLAAAMVFAFAACGGKTEDDTTTTTTDLFAEFEDDTTAAPAEDSTDAAPVEDSSAAPADATTAAAAEDSTAAAGESTAAAESTTAASAGLNSTNAEEVVAYYNAAVIKTNDSKKAPKGHSTMKLDGDITGDGAIGAILSVLSPAAEKALAKNSVETDYIPGKGMLKASDVTKAQASSKNGVTTIVIQLKDQTDGPDGDSKNGGPVARGIGTLGSIESALKELGAEMTEGRETVKLTYTNAYIKCTIDESTGMVTGGTWHYLVKIFVGDAKAKLGITANLKNLKAAVDYTVAI